MTPSVWVAMAGLFAGLFVQAAVFAFMLARMSQRVTLEREGSALQGICDAVTDLTVQMENAQGDISQTNQIVIGMQRSLSHIMTDRASKPVELTPTRKRRRGGQE